MFIFLNDAIFWNGAIFLWISSQFLKMRFFIDVLKKQNIVQMMRISDVFANYWVHIGSIIGSILKPQTSFKTSHFLLSDAVFLSMFDQFLTMRFLYRCLKKM